MSTIFLYHYYRHGTHNSLDTYVIRNNKWIYILPGIDRKVPVEKVDLDFLFLHLIILLQYYSNTNNTSNTNTFNF